MLILYVILENINELIKYDVIVLQLERNMWKAHEIKKELIIKVKV